MSYFPRDLVALFRLQLIPLAALPIGWLVFRFREWSFVYLAIGFAVVGVILLVVARLPLYRRRCFFTFGPSELDASHRRLYRRGYGFVAISVFLFLFLVALLHVTPNI